MRQFHPLVACLDEQDDGSLKISESYFDRAPSFQMFTGTPIANRHGGWGKQVEVVEFFYRVEDMINAVIGAGFRIERVAETNQEGVDSLPSHFTILAMKEGTF